MENFEFKVNDQAPYIKAIRFLGTALLGFFIGAIIFTLKYEGTFEWMNLTGILLSLFFAFFPGKNNPSLTIDEKGIHLHNYTFHWGEKNEIMWEKVKGIRVHKNVIEIKNSIGSTEKIKLPLHTKEQLEELRSYLKQMTEVKGLEYLK
jgi:hypothetical protein